MHHKRRRPKNRRSGCLFCKPHKANHAKASYKLTVHEKRQVERERSDGDELLDWEVGL